MPTIIGRFLVERGKPMARPVAQAKIEGRRLRAKLKPGRQARWPEDKEGRRSYVGGAYRILSLGAADDVQEADGEKVLSFEQAHAAAVAALAAPKGKRHRLTVRQATDLYIDFKAAQGRPTRDLKSRAAAHILPTLGDDIVSELTAERLRRWLSDLANSPAYKRTAKGKPQRYKAAPKDDEAKRKRQASANRVLSMLKAALNFVFDEGHVENREAWGRRLKPFEGADAARLRYLQIEEAQRLVNAADLDFRQLVRAGLYTGARYGQLIALTADRFNPDAGTVQLRSRKGRGKLKVYNVVLNDEGRAFFEEVVAGKRGADLIFHHSSRIDRARERGESVEDDPGEWREAEAARPMREACKRAKISPPLGFHQIRHTYASHAVMNGVPLLVVAQNLGHSGTAMVEKFYGHLAPSYVADAIRSGAPRFGLEPSRKIVPLRKSGG
jgi:integrase